MFTGKVIVGSGLGRKYGYPTANIDIKQEDLKLKSGVYAAYAVLKGKRYPAALAIKDSPWRVEVYLLDYSGPDFYGTHLEVEPVEKVENIERIDSEAELKNKIARDLRIIKKSLFKN